MKNLDYTTQKILNMMFNKYRITNIASILDLDLMHVLQVCYWYRGLVAIAIRNARLYISLENLSTKKAAIKASTDLVDHHKLYLLLVAGSLPHTVFSYTFPTVETVHQYETLQKT